ncbi:MAG: alkaline phosphatase family protein [Chlorobi bacterium]|nr:alkaline phosphatase family protein [Chlorobiota bacterium]
MNKFSKTLLLLILAAGISLAGEKNIPRNPKVKLVVQIVVDQLRGDILSKFDKNLSKEGFKYLSSHGMNFTNANYIHAITKTAPGHATIATGSIPALHGIIGNDWLDEKTGKTVYACGDANANVFGEDMGLSPKNLVVSTLSDELFLATDGKAKIFGVSIKDRGAIFLAGHSGKAFWFSRKNGGFTSSKYYFDELPEYVSEFNRKDWLDNYYKQNWDLLLPKEKYLYKDIDENDYEMTEKGLGKTFPHDFSGIPREKFNSVFPFTPYGDEFTYEFAKTVITENQIGQDSVTDYFSISFSVTDYIGHSFSPNSLEYEDQIYRLDGTIGKFLKFLDKKIGLENILIVFTADHGVAESPDFLAEKKQPSGVLYFNDFGKLCNDFGRDKYKIDFDLVKDLITPNLYLDEEKIKRAGLSICEVENDLKELIVKADGVYDALTSCGIEHNELNRNLIDVRVANSYFPGRSGNLYVINLPGWYFAFKNGERYSAATHGTPWNYDAYVPLIFCGPGIERGYDSSECGPHDIAPSIADYLGIKKPSGSVGKMLLK